MEMMYIFPMMLGSTFDMHTYRTGINLFPPDVLSAKWMFRHESFSDKKVLIKNLGKTNIVDIPTDLSLKVKAGYVDLKEAGKFIKEFGMTEKTSYILFLVKAYYFLELLPSFAKPLSNWTEYEEKYLGTHYVRTITYGSNVFVSIAIRMLETTNVSIDALFTKINITMGTLIGKYEELQKDLQGVADTKLSFFSNYAKEVPQTLVGLREIMTNSFKNNFMYAAKVELKELSALDDRFTFKKNKDLMRDLRRFEYKFDDLRRAKSFTTDWMKTVSSSLKPEQKQKINEYLKRVDEVLKSFHDTIKLLNTENGSEQLNESIKAYSSNGSALPGKYIREFDKLRNAVNKELQQE